ncbi:hypothetical protein LUZ60_014210 [Juncus effusus]|nr:hypothetical protein LUZ60_014210 [Juncus effusus]
MNFLLFLCSNQCAYSSFKSRLFLFWAGLKMSRRHHQSADQGGSPPSASAGAPAPAVTPASLAEGILAHLSQNLPFNLLQFPFQNPNPSFGFSPNPASFLFQNPNFLQNANPNPRPAPLPVPHLITNPNLTVSHPNPNPNPNSNPGASTQQRNPSSQSQQWLLKKAINLASKAHEDLLSKGESVSGCKVARSVLSDLDADSWESLGIQMKDVKPLQQIFQIEGRVNDFVNCYVLSRNIQSLHDLESSLCKSEGVSNFQDLRLGPFLKQPIIARHFSFPSTLQKAVKITTEEIVRSFVELKEERGRDKVLPSQLVEFIAKKWDVAEPDRLGVRMKNLGSLARYVNQAKDGEQEALKEASKKLENIIEEREKYKRPSKKERTLLKLLKNSEEGETSSRKKPSKRGKELAKFLDREMPSHERPGKREREASKEKNNNNEGSSKGKFDSEKKELDSKFDNLTQKMEEFSSSFSGFKGKHIRFVSSDEGTDSSDNENNNNNTSNNKSNNISNNKSKCPYPSSTEELARLKLNSNNNSNSKERSGSRQTKRRIAQRERKRKLKQIEPSPVLNVKKKKRKIETGSVCVNGEEMERFVLSKEDLEKFIATWKESCKTQSIFELVATMADFYKLSKKDTGRMKRLFKCFPLIGLLNVAVKSMANGFSDSLYETMQALDQNGAVSVSSDCVEILEIPPSKKEEDQNGVVDSKNKTKSDSDTSKTGVTTEEIIKKITEYFKSNDLFLVNGALYLQSLHDCSTWVSSQLSVDHFLSLGHGHFIPFLQKHVSLLPLSLQNLVNGEISDPNSLVSIHQRQLSILLSLVGPVQNKTDFLSLLEKQFPTLSFHISGNFLDGSKPSENNPTGVLFSHTLLSSENSNNNVQKCVKSSREAFECLIKAPMLSDLISFSHWEVVFAPSLGSFFDWFLSLGQNAELACVAIRDGRFIRVENSANVDQFLEAFMNLSSYWAAVKLLSLLYQNRGSKNTPISLLKLYSERATTVLIKNCSESIIVKFILDCLGQIPSEFWPFAMDILLSGLKSVTKNVYSVVLNECGGTRERFMLHDIGLSLGIIEWISDYNQFVTSGNININPLNQSPNFNSADKTSIITSTTPKIGNITSHHENNDEEMNISDPLISSSDSNILTESGTNEFIYLGDDNNVKEACKLIEKIRCDEFGLDPNLSENESSLLQKQHARLGRALHCLSQELYSQDSHLLLELVQNADDNIYPQNAEPTLCFILQKSGIVVLNNERGFTAKNIRALCDIGNSTKKGSGGGYIGNKGIGFKSVFRVTDSPEIHSNGFHIKFDISKGQIGFVLPTLIPPCDISKLGRLLPADITTGEAHNPASWRTCISLPFKTNSELIHVQSLFQDLHPSLLLFLNKLKCIKFKSEFDGMYKIMRKENLGNGIIRVSDGNNTMNWLVVRKKLSGGIIIRPEVQTTEIAMAFTLEESQNSEESTEFKPYLTHQPVFAFLPLRNYGLKFILQADFILPTSREEVDSNSAWNQWLLSEFPDLFISALDSFCKLPYFEKNIGKGISAYMSFVPLLGEVHGFFSGLPNLIISKLRANSCLILDGSDLKWVKPCSALRGWNDQFRQLISDELLEESLGLGFMSRDIILPDSLAKSLDICEFGPRVLYDATSALFKNDEFVKGLTMDWLSCWLIMLHNSLLVHSSKFRFEDPGLESEILNGLRKIPFIPLSDGSYSSVSEGHIWLPCDFSEGKYGIKDFPLLYSNLRTVNAQLLNALNSSDELTEILVKIGVRKLSAHEIITSHVLNSLSKSTIESGLSNELMVEYLAFILLHFQSPCMSCQSEKESIMQELRNKHVILTNQGFFLPAGKPIHFGTQYGNAVDINRLIDQKEYKWYNVDESYINHSSSRFLPNKLRAWREFLKELGVTDFIQVISVQRDSPSNNNNSVINDWVSPELIGILYTLSVKKNRQSSIYMLEILDKLWDEYYSDKALIGEESVSVQSAFVKSLHGFKWVACNYGDELYNPSDLFYDCADIKALFGDNVPYAAPQVTSKLLLKEIGFKTAVTPNEALKILSLWAKYKISFKASVDQMSRLYTYISDSISNSTLTLNQEFLKSPFVFAPIQSSLSSQTVRGEFLSPKDVYWLDPTGCFDKTKELIISKKRKPIQCKMLACVYPGLCEFFVNKCGVNEFPSFGMYVDLLLDLSKVASPSEASHLFSSVIIRWVKDMDSGLAKYDDISQLKQSLNKTENKILPTIQGKWVSLHSSCGLTCWVDDQMLTQHFKNYDGVNFLVMKEVEGEFKGKVASLMQGLGIPALSKIITREVIHHGTLNDVQKAGLINWALKYAQRYICKMHPLLYVSFKELEQDKLNSLKIVVAGKLYYKYFIKGISAPAGGSQNLFEASSLLKDTTLYVTPSTDTHSLYLELSRLFFDGSPDLLFANFLHMLTTMLDSGASARQLDFFLLNNQNIPQIPNSDPVWSLCPKLNPLLNPVPLFYNNNNGNNGDVMQVFGLDRTEEGFGGEGRKDWMPVPIEIEADFITEEDNLENSVKSPHGLEDSVKSPSRLEDSVKSATNLENSVKVSRWDSSVKSPPRLSESDVQITSPRNDLPNPLNTAGASTSATTNGVNVTNTNQVVVPNRNFGRYNRRRDQDNAANQRTGRIGEMVAYKYFSNQMGSKKVRWVNELTETGLPYDLVIENGDEREFVEVKATVYASKDWFEITLREWQFACERGELFTIAHVILMGNGKASIIVLKNLYRLCMEHTLRLAVFMSGLHRDGLAESSNNNTTTTNNNQG